MNYMKLVWALAGTLALGLQTGLSDGVLSLEDGLLVGAAGLASVGTWLVPNTPALATAKVWVNAFVLGTGTLVTVLPDGVTGQEWMTVGIAVLTAAGVYMVPNKVAENRDFRLSD
jgi:hypothetical protein